MDSITQAVLGAAIGEAGFRHKLGRRALVFGAAFGTLPDLDIVAGLAGEWESLLHHRGPSHSLLVLPLLAPLFAWFGWRAYGRRDEFRTWWHLAFWALITHPILDTFTSYGTQLLSPLSMQRFALDGLSIVDPVYTVPLALAVALGLRRAAGLRSRVFAAAMLLFTTSYGLYGYTKSLRVIDRAERALAAEGFEPVKVRAMPTILNQSAFRVAARDARGDMRVGYTTASDDVPLKLVPIDGPRGPLFERVLQDERGRILYWFADGYLRAETFERDGRTVLRLHDIRYGRMLQPDVSMWGAEAIFDHGALVDVRRWNNQRTMDVSAEWDAQWALILDGELPDLYDDRP